MDIINALMLASRPEGIGSRLGPGEKTRRRKWKGESADDQFLTMSVGMGGIGRRKANQQIVMNRVFGWTAFEARVRTGQAASLHRFLFLPVRDGGGRWSLTVVESTTSKGF